jgi:hypothetical protein
MTLPEDSMSVRVLLVLTFLAATTATQVSGQAPGPSKVYVGYVSDSMCGINHTAMGISPDPKCVVECLKHGRSVRYVLVEEKTKAMYTLSDQQAPEKFAAQKVRVTGVLYPKTKILKVEKIEGAK